MVEHAWGNDSECDGVTRSMEHGLSCLRVDTETAKGLVYVQGAHVAEWCPAGQDPVLWMSREAVYRAGKALRGHSGKRHLMGTKKPKRMRLLKKMALVHPADLEHVKRMLPYG